MEFNEKGRFIWESFPDIMDFSVDLDKFVESDCLCGVIKVLKFNKGESYQTGNQPSSLGEVTSLCEIKNLVNIEEFKVASIYKCFGFGQFSLVIEDKLTPKERILREN